VKKYAGYLSKKGQENVISVHCERGYLLRAVLTNSPHKSSSIDYILRIVNKDRESLYKQVDEDGSDGTTTLKSAPCHIPYTGEYKVIVYDKGMDDCAPSEKYSLLLKHYLDPDKNEINNRPSQCGNIQLGMYMAAKLQSNVQTTGMIT